MAARRAMTHFAIDAWLAEFEMVRFETTPFRISQLAGVAHSAVGLVAGDGTERLKRPDIGAGRTLRIDNLPEVQPSLVQHVVLNRKNVNLPVGQPRGVGLLPLGTNRVVDGIAHPRSTVGFDFEEVSSFVFEHPRIWKTTLSRG